MRIASLIASSTEIICALGFGDDLVGRSHECDHPEWVKRLPALTEPKLPTDGTSYEIDQRIKAILQEGLAVYRVFVEKLEAVRPEVIVTQSQCEVCAVSLSDVRTPDAEWCRHNHASCPWNRTTWRAYSATSARWPRHWVPPGPVPGWWPRSVNGWPPSNQFAPARLQATRGLHGVDRAPHVGWRLDARAGRHGRRRVALRTGWRACPWLDWDDLRAADPDVVFVSPCGFDIPRTLAEMPLLEKRPGWHKGRAVREGRVIVADGNQYFNRPGPRLVESLEILAEVLHPGALPPQHRGSGWVPWPQA